jgi:hypothetical protein
LEQNIWWWCENKCNNKHTPLINPSKWTFMYYWCRNPSFGLATKTKGL